MPFQSTPTPLRRTETIRRMIRETRLSPDDSSSRCSSARRGVKKPSPRCPVVSQMSVDNMRRRSAETFAAGVPAVILFGIPERKDANGSEAWNDDGEVQRAIPRDQGTRAPGCGDHDVCMCESPTTPLRRARGNDVEMTRARAADPLGAVARACGRRYRRRRT